MKIKELRQKSEAELQNLLDKSRDRLIQFKFNVSLGKEKNVKEARTLRRDIARIFTLLNPPKAVRSNLTGLTIINQSEK
ncbi:MAG: 50S ribosomal protein L29 [Candidatus Niyogibacteria bacterium]|nr:50S ribosomal protein L29 [Candidatus Niyogibacteria bacterium]